MTKELYRESSGTLHTEKMQGDEHQSGWKEMTDTKSGKKYWVNYATKQMSYTAPQSQEMVSEQARSAKSDIQSHIASGESPLEAS